MKTKTYIVILAIFTLTLTAACATTPRKSSYGPLPTTNNHPIRDNTLTFFSWISPLFWFIP